MVLQWVVHASWLANFDAPEIVDQLYNQLITNIEHKTCQRILIVGWYLFAKTTVR